MNPDLPNSQTKAFRPHPDTLAPGPQPALTHQAPGGGIGSTSTPTCPLHPPGRYLGCLQLSESRPGAGAAMRLGITPKTHVSSFHPLSSRAARQPGSLLSWQPQPPHQPAQWSPLRNRPLTDYTACSGSTSEGIGTGNRLAGSQNARDLPSSLRNAPCPLSAAGEGRNVLSSGKSLPGLAASKGWGVAETQPEPSSQEEWKGQCCQGC